MQPRTKPVSTSSRRLATRLRLTRDRIGVQSSAGRCSVYPPIGLSRSLDCDSPITKRSRLGRKGGGRRHLGWHTFCEYGGRCEYLARKKHSPCDGILPVSTTRTHVCSARTGCLGYSAAAPSRTQPATEPTGSESGRHSVLAALLARYGAPLA
jgi:hypothetical protein